MDQNQDSLVPCSPNPELNSLLGIALLQNASPKHWIVAGLEQQCLHQDK